jgi:hypothetical protein
MSSFSSHRLGHLPFRSSAAACTEAALQHGRLHPLAKVQQRGVEAEGHLAQAGSCWQHGQMQEATPWMCSDCNSLTMWSWNAATYDLSMVCRYTCSVSSPQGFIDQLMLASLLSSLSPGMQQ